jgi:hypothetical protein
MKKILFRVVLLVMVAGGAWYGYSFFKSLPSRTESIASTKVRQGDVVVRSYTRGELRAVRSATLTAPNLFGTVQVTRLSPLGAFAREKDLVVEFDDSEVNSRLEEKQLEIEQIDEQLKKAQADLAMRSNQDQVELLSARYAVRRAELEVQRNELLSNIDAKKNQLNLEEAKRRLKQLESDVKSRQEQAQAELAVLRERKNKSQLELNRERARLSQVKLLAPISGLVAMRQNRTGFMFPGMQVPDIREGDQVQPGIPVADILDLSEMEIVAKVGELDRANLKEGQEATLRLDALPEKNLHATIKSMSGTASAAAFSFDPAKKFDVVFAIDMRELLGALGAKPDQIQKILATAEANRKRPITASSSPMMAGLAGGGPQMMTMQGGPGGGAPGGMPVMQGAPGGFGETGGQAGPGGPGGEGGGRGARGGGGGGGMRAFQDMPPEAMQKVREAMQKFLNGRSPQDLTPEDRQKMQQAIQEAMKSAGVTPPSREGRRAGGGEQAGAPGEAGARRNRGEGGQAGAGAAEGGAPRMGFSLGPGGGRGGEGGLRPNLFGGGLFTEKDMANAKLPPPPEEDTQFDVLLRPGLLADVEIIVEKVPNAIHVPMQAVFEREGKMLVYVKADKGWEPRVIKPLKRSESTMVIAEGVKPNEVIALADPFARKSDSKKDSSGKGGAMSALPGGGK